MPLPPLHLVLLILVLKVKLLCQVVFHRLWHLLLLIQVLNVDLTHEWRWSSARWSLGLLSFVAPFSLPWLVVRILFVKHSSLLLVGRWSLRKLLHLLLALLLFAHLLGLSTGLARAVLLWRNIVGFLLLMLLHHLEHLLVVGIVHAELFGKFILFSHLFIYDRLVFLLIICAFIPLAVSFVAMLGLRRVGHHLLAAPVLLFLGVVTLVGF